MKNEPELVFLFYILTYDVGYLCANFSLPGPLFSRLRPD